MDLLYARRACNTPKTKGKQLRHMTPSIKIMENINNISNNYIFIYFEMQFINLMAKQPLLQSSYEILKKSFMHSC